MTTTTKRPALRQTAELVQADLDYLYVWHPAAWQEVTRVLNVTIPLASAIRDGYIKALTDYGRGELEAGADSLHAIRESITPALEASCLAANRWAAMWDHAVDRPRAASA